MERQIFKNGVLHFDYTAAQLAPAETKAREELEKDLSAVIAVPKEQRNFQNTVKDYAAAFEKYGYAFGAAMFLAQVSPDKELREAAVALQMTVSAYLVEVGTRKPLYNAVKEYADTKPKLDVPEAKILKNMMIGFKKNGLHLPDDKLEIFKKLSIKSSELSINFGKNIRDNTDFLAVTKRQLKGLPQDYIDRLEKTADGKYKITLAYPDYIPFMTLSESNKARKELEFKNGLRGGRENVKFLEEDLKLTHDMAALLGYKSHADMRLEQRMAKNPKNVFTFLKDLEEKLKPFAEKEREEIKKYKSQKTGKPAKRVYPWEGAYWGDKYVKEFFGVDDEKIKEYFPADAVIEGMFEIFGNLFGVKFEPAQIPVWHKDVKTYKVINSSDGKLQAYIYWDMFPREGKFKHAACFDLVNGRQNDHGSYQIPFAAVVSNFNPPSANTPSLLKHGEVETLFHEFGHVLHCALTTAKYSSIAGSSVKWDFVETPSQMCENWAWSPAVLKRISRHFKTGETLPDDIIQKMINAKNYGSASGYLRQNFLSQYDMYVYTRKKEVDSTKTYFTLRKKITGTLPTRGTIPQASFDHIMNGYDAGYYSYLWAKVIAEDFFNEFEKAGLDNAELGKKFRDQILAVGGTYEEEEIVEKFLGRKVDNQPFLKSIGLSESQN